jgi:hypothetical protein
MILYEEIFKDFQKMKVKYALVGGIAFNLLGGIRNTHDMDILVEMTDENLKKIVTVLKKHGYTVKQPVDPMGIANAETRKDWIKNKHMKAFNFYKDEDLKEVDIIIESPVSYEKASKNLIVIPVGKMKLFVIGIDDLIKMKESAGRAVDQIDIRALELIKKARRYAN